MVHYCRRFLFISPSVFPRLSLLVRFTILSFHCGCCLASFYLRVLMPSVDLCVSVLYFRMASVSRSLAYCGVFISAVPAWFVSYYVLIGSLVVSVVFLSLLCTSMSLMFLCRLYDIIGSFGSFSEKVFTYQFILYFEQVCRILSRLLRTFSWEIMWCTSSIIPVKEI